MQYIYNYINEGNHISRVHNFAVILWLQSMVHLKVFPLINFAHYYYYYYYCYYYYYFGKVLILACSAF